MQDLSPETVQAQPQAESAPPQASKAAAGCLILPALVGACVLMFAVMSMVGSGVNKVVGEGTVPATLLSGELDTGQVMTWAWFAGCMMALRAILGGVRKRWVYWLTIVCLAWLVLMTAAPLVLGISFFDRSSGLPLTLLEWAMCVLCAAILTWFGFSPRNHRHYRVFCRS